jgi:hypothetical protein
MKTPVICFFCLFLGLSSNAFALEHPQSDSLFRLGISCSINFNLNNKRASNYFFSVAVGASYRLNTKKDWVPDFLPSGQVAFNLYRGAIGTSIHPDERGKNQFEIVPTAALTTQLGPKEFFGSKPIKTFCNFNAVALSHSFKNSLTLATNFVINTGDKMRNQQVGFGGLSFGDFAFGYYNDGPPWNKVGLGDSYDRFWTGGGYFEIWTLGARFRAGIYYDNFTGTNNDAITEGFELANILNINKVDFVDKRQFYYNRGQLMVRMAIPNGFGMSFMLSGDKFMIIQNLIHGSMGQAVYPSFANNRFHTGFFFEKPYQLQPKP